MARYDPATAVSVINWLPDPDPKDIFTGSTTRNRIQCCGSGMFISDPGSGFFPIPDPGSKNQIWANLRIIELFTQKIVTKLSKIWLWDPGSGKNLFRILDPGVKKAPDPESRIRNNTDRIVILARRLPEAGSSPFGTSPQLAAPARATYAAVRYNRKCNIFC
jgi:hypothetical protein